MISSKVYQTREREGVYNDTACAPLPAVSISDQREGGVYNKLEDRKDEIFSISDQRDGGVYN